MKSLFRIVCLFAVLTVALQAQVTSVTKTTADNNLTPGSGSVLGGFNLTSSTPVKVNSGATEEVLSGGTLKFDSGALFTGTGVNAAGGPASLNSLGILPESANGVSSLQLPSASPLPVVIVGDSIALGIHASGAYTNLSGRLFDQNFAYNCPVYNFGVSGHNTQACITDYTTNSTSYGYYNPATRLLGSSPSASPHSVLATAGGGYIVVLIGTNDYDNGVAVSGTISGGSTNTISSIVLQTGSLPLSNIASGYLAWQGTTQVGIVGSYNSGTATVVLSSGNFNTTGTNQAVAFTAPLATAEGYYTTLINDFLADNAKVEILNLLPGGVAGTTTGNTWVYFQGNRLLLNTWINSRFGNMAFNANVIVADTADIPELQPTFIYQSSYYYTDYVHPIDQGYNRIAQLANQQLALNFPTTYSVNLTDILPGMAYGTNPIFASVSTAGTAYPFASLTNVGGAGPTTGGIALPIVNSSMANGTYICGSLGPSSVTGYNSMSWGFYYAGNNNAGNYAYFGLNGTYGQIYTFPSGDVTIGAYGANDEGVGLAVGSAILAYTNVTANGYVQSTSQKIIGSATTTISSGAVSNQTASYPNSSGTLGLLPTMTSNATGTITFNNTLNDQTIYNTSGSTISSATITLPTTSQPGQIVSYATAAIVTSITMAGGTVDIGTAPTTAAAGNVFIWQSDISGHWIRRQ